MISDTSTLLHVVPVLRCMYSTVLVPRVGTLRVVCWRGQRSARTQTSSPRCCPAFPCMQDLASLDIIIHILATLAQPFFCLFSDLLPVRLSFCQFFACYFFVLRGLVVVACAVAPRFRFFFSCCCCLVATLASFPKYPKM